MDYQITCICGHTFQVSGDKIRGEVECPACHQRLSPAVQAPAAPAAPSAPPPAATTPSATTAATGDPSSPEPTKRCPFCGEVILAIAKKCKHCGEFLDRAPPSTFPPSAALTANAPTGPASAAPANDPVYSLYISQWDNFWRYLTLAAIFIFVTFVLGFFQSLREYLAVGALGTLVLAGFVGWFSYLKARGTHVVIRPLRIDVEKGILTKNLESLELFRITDVALKQGLIARILGFGTIHLTTDDTDSPEMTLYCIPRAREIRQYLQTQIPIAARQRGAVYLEK